MVHNLGRTLAYARRSYYLRLALGVGDLSAAFEAGIAVGSPGNSKVSNSRAKLYQNSLRKNLHPTWTSKLTQVVDQYLRRGLRFDVARWGAGVDATARRAGLVLTGDLETAIRNISSEPAFTAVADYSTKRRDLILYSISEEHFSLREELGMKIPKNS
jgi:hypothetical protein